MSVVTSSSFVSSKLGVGEYKALEKSGQVYLNYDGKIINLQGPQLTVPYDANDYKGDGKFKVQFSFKGRDTRPLVAKFHDTIEAIDNFVIDQAVKNCGKWFKKPGMTRDMLKLFFKPTIRYSKDKDGNEKREYPPHMAVALKRKGTREAPGPFVAEIFDDGRKLIEGVTPVEALRRNAEVVPILTCGGVWVVDGKFGVTWTLKQAVIKVPGDGAGSAGAFLGVEEETDGTLVTAADEDLMAAVLPSKSSNKFAAAAPAEEEDDEEEEEEEEDHTEEAPPVPAAKPGKVTKAAVVETPAPVKAASGVPKVGKATKAAK
jgi:hypothetical protein